jgi:DNA-binding response OmpR family regulator
MSTMAQPNNPYFRLPIGFEPEKYYGSQDWVRFVLEQISARLPQSFEFLGLPGMGKSTLMRYLADPKGAREKQCESLQEPFRTEPHRLFAVLVEFRLLPPDVHPFVYLYNRFCEEYVRYRESMRKAQGLELPEQFLRETVKRPEQAVGLLQEGVEALAEAEARTILLLDDFDLAFEKLTFDQTSRLRPLRRQVAFVLALERALHVVNPKAAGSRFFQTMPLKRLGGLTAGEARRLIEEPACQSGKPFPKHDVDYILKQSDGHPYLLILAGNALWNLRERLDILENQDVALSEEHLAVLRGHLQEDYRLSFQLYWNHLEPNEQEVLGLLVRDTELADIPGRVLDALGPLAEKGLVSYDTEARRYRPFSPLFAEFVEQQVSSAHRVSEPPLTGLEANLYDYLRSRMNATCTFDELWHEIWDSPSMTEIGERERQRRMQVTISRLRNKLKSLNGEDIVSVRGQGYRFLSREYEARERKSQSTSR